MGPTQFIAALRASKLQPAYFLRGPDRFLHEECRKAVIAALPAETRDWCLSEIEFSPKELGQQLQGAYQMPMLGSRTFFVFTDPEDFKSATDDDVAALERYLKQPSPFATTVFAAVEPDRRRKFIQLLERKVELVEMLPLNRYEAARWLSGHLNRAGVEIAPELATEIAAKFEKPAESGSNRDAGVNLLWLRTELEKLLTARPEAKRVEAADLTLLVAFREETEIGKLLRAVAERQFALAVENLRALLAGKQSEILILWCIGDLVRQALKCGSGSSRSGAGYGRTGWSRNPLSTQEIAPLAARKYTHRELLQALRSVRQADLGIKSSWKDSRILLEFLIWQIITGKSSETLLPMGESVPAMGGA
jgi:DNA polymerase-3 subunit delta